jgi:hypoxanthine phosphoribosyltransferase
MQPGHTSRIIISAARLRRRVKEMAADISRDYAGKDLIVVAVLKGSVIFLADLVRHLKVDFALDFLAVSSYRGKSSTGRIKILMDLRDNPKGKNILVVEDIVDSGGTLALLLKKLKARKPVSVRTCVLLDKPAARRVPVTADYTGFKIKDNFVVGYGLDYNEKYRGLPHIGIIKSK